MKKLFRFFQMSRCVALVLYEDSRCDDTGHVKDKGRPPIKAETPQCSKSERMIFLGRYIAGELGQTTLEFMLICGMSLAMFVLLGILIRAGEMNEFVQDSSRYATHVYSDHAGAFLQDISMY